MRQCFILILITMLFMKGEKIEHKDTKKNDIDKNRVAVFTVFFVICLFTVFNLIDYRIMFFIPRAPIIYIITYVFNFTAIASIMLILFLTLGEIYIKRYRRA